MQRLGEAGAVIGSGVDPRADRGLNTDAKRHYEIKLRTGWFNPDLDKLLPPGASFVVEITLHAAKECMVSYAGMLTN